MATLLLPYYSMINMATNLTSTIYDYSFQLDR